MISYLSDKFAGEAYKFVEIDSPALAELRAEETLWCYETIVRFEDFQIALSIPGSETFKAYPVFVFAICVF